MTGQCSFRCPGNCLTVIPSMPGLPLLAFTRRSACLQFSRSQTSFIHCSAAGLSALRFANSDSVPPTETLGASPLLSSAKARRYWFFCRLSVVESRRVLIAPFIPLAGSVRAFTAFAATTPSADSCHLVRNDLSLLSPDSRADGRSPEVSSTAFDAQPLDLHSVFLMDVGFAAVGQLARTLPASYPVLVHRLAPLLHASFRPHLTVTPLRFATLHLHQVGTGLSPVSCRTCAAYNEEGQNLSVLPLKRVKGLVN